MSTEWIDQAFRVAQIAARKASQHALNNQASELAVVSTSPHDVKLQLDIDCQALIQDEILEAFPDHIILGEEGTDHVLDANQSDTPIWIVDPIDGTVNFKHGHPYWCCSIGIYYRGQPVVGIVEAPAMHMSFSASENHPAECNGAVIHSSNTGTLADAMIHCGLDKNVRPGVPPLSILGSIAKNCRKARIIGSAALDLCFLARGISDGYIESNIYLWDVAAAGYIAERAGAKVEFIDYDPTTQKVTFIACAPSLFEDFSSLVLDSLNQKSN